jgi:hypothetical protein
MALALEYGMVLDIIRHSKVRCGAVWKFATVFETWHYGIISSILSQYGMARNGRQALVWHVNRY